MASLLSGELLVLVAHSIGCPSSDAMGCPSSDAMDFPLSDAMVCPSSDAIGCPSSDVIGCPSSETIALVMNFPLPMTGTIFWHSDFHAAYCSLRIQISNR